MKVFLDKRSEKATVDIEQIVNNELLFNSDFNGIEVEFIYGQESIWIEGVDEISGTFLLHKIIDHVNSK